MLVLCSILSDKIANLTTFLSTTQLLISSEKTKERDSNINLLLRVLESRIFSIGKDSTIFPILHPNKIN